MDNTGDKIYRIKIKEGAHLNDKLKKDGSRVALQFDKDNNLKGPVDLIEVDKREFTKEVPGNMANKNNIGAEIVKGIAIPVLGYIATTIANEIVESAKPVIKTKFDEYAEKAKEKREMNKEKKAMKKMEKEAEKIEETDTIINFTKRKANKDAEAECAPEVAISK